MPKKAARPSAYAVLKAHNADLVNLLIAAQQNQDIAVAAAVLEAKEEAKRELWRQIEPLLPKPKPPSRNPWWKFWNALWRFRR